MLVREKLSEIKVSKDLDSVFAEDCEKILDYKIAKSTLDARLNEAKVVDILNQLGIEPFNKESVNVYKQKQLDSVDFFKTWMFPISLVVIIAISLVLSFCFSFGWLFLNLLCFVPVVYGAVIEPEWRTVKLCHASILIPEFALQTALDVSKGLKEAGVAHQFCIDYFHQPNLSDAFKNDPFLYLDCYSNQYYLEVWNEPGFKQKREI